VIAPAARRRGSGRGRLRSDYDAQNATGQPDFIDRGIVRLLDGPSLDVSGPTTPILICPC
jgi:hypothetical protein